LGDGLRVAVLAGLDETDVLLEQVD
jgi:hypothetical protein